MSHGLIIGKFLPFHLGHQALIHFGLSKCQELTVVICVSDQEEIPGHVRKKWIEESFEDQKNLHLIVFAYSETQLTNQSESSREVSRQWAVPLKQLVPKASHIISSEPYGAWLAEYMGIQSITFDLDRSAVPVSATQIRQNPASYWEFIPKSVRPFYAKKVVLLGTESTGKSTLSKKLADYFQASLVEEAGRALIPDSSKFELKQLYAVAHEHARQIKIACQADRPLLIIDTDVHITQSYAWFYFQQYLNLDAELYEINHAQLYLYQNANVPYVQDGSRMVEDQRNLLDQSHRQTLKHFGINYHEINGKWDERFHQMKSLVQQIIR